MKKRLAVYCFYDQDGIVDDYVVFFLNSLRKTVSKICCVVNGTLDDKGRESLGQCSDEILQKENTDAAAWAYSYFVNVRYREIRTYDELIFCNNSFFGPLYPLADMFSEMEHRKDHKDFWGITVSPGIKGHVESYFMVFEKRTIESPAFIDFFKTHNKTPDCKRPCSLFDLQLTQALSSAGFSYGSFTDSSGLPGDDCTVLYPDLLIGERKCPFLKRKVFSVPYENLFAVGRGQNPRKCLEFIKNNTAYNAEYIWQYLLRTQKMSDLRQNLNLNYILSSDACGEFVNPGRKIALVCYVYYPDDVRECLSYASNAEEIADLYFVSSRDDTLDAARKFLERSEFPKVEFKKKINKGRDLAAYLIDCAPLFDSYDYLCFVHDKKSPQNSNQETTHEFFKMCMESMLSSKAYVKNLLNLFENHPKLGVAVMPPLNFGIFYTNEYVLHPGNRRHIANLLCSLDLQVPFDENPVAPYGDMFWCRTAALRKLFSRQWAYEDLPDEPLPVDGTILHALERIHPFVAQASGYYSAWVHPDSAAETYMNNLHYIDRTLNESLFSHFGYSVLPKLVEKIALLPDSNGISRLLQKLQSAVFRARRCLIKLRLKNKQRDMIQFFSTKKGIWDEEYYLRKNPDVSKGGIPPLEHYIKNGWKKNLSPSPLYSTEDYLQTNPDCRMLGLSPLEHYYISCGKRLIFCSYESIRKYSDEHGIEILRKTAMFNKEYYLRSYLRKYGKIPEGFEPYSYYLAHGAQETVKPSPHFRVHKYLDRFPELKIYNICPVIHYELVGKYI